MSERAALVHPPPSGAPRRKGEGSEGGIGAPDSSDLSLFSWPSDDAGGEVDDASAFSIRLQVVVTEIGLREVDGMPGASPSLQCKPPPHSKSN